MVECGTPGDPKPGMTFWEFGPTPTEVIDTERCGSCWSATLVDLLPQQAFDDISAAAVDDVSSSSEEEMEDALA